MGEAKFVWKILCANHTSLMYPWGQPENSIMAYSMLMTKTIKLLKEVSFLIP